MARNVIWIRAGTLLIVLSLLISSTSVSFVAAQATGPQMLDPRLSVRTVLSGLTTPTTMAFLSPTEFFVLEKNTGKVQYIVNGVFHHTALDLAVNMFSACSCFLALLLTIPPSVGSGARGNGVCQQQRIGTSIPK